MNLDKGLSEVSTEYLTKESCVQAQQDLDRLAADKAAGDDSGASGDGGAGDDDNGNTTSVDLGSMLASAQLEDAYTEQDGASTAPNTWNSDLQ